jgi:hypothetical protein
VSKATASDTQKKCEEILRSIVAACNEVPDHKGGPVIGFAPDWGGHSLTVWKNSSHTHVGNIADDGTFEQLIDQLHDMLLKGRGLSWA